MRATIELRIPLTTSPRPKSMPVRAGTYRRARGLGDGVVSVPAQTGRVTGWCDDRPNCQTRLMVEVEAC